MPRPGRRRLDPLPPDVEPEPPVEQPEMTMSVAVDHDCRWFADGFGVCGSCGARVESGVATVTPEPLTSEVRERAEAISRIADGLDVSPEVSEQIVAGFRDGIQARAARFTRLDEDGNLVVDGGGTLRLHPELLPEGAVDAARAGAIDGLSVEAPEREQDSPEDARPPNMVDWATEAPEPGRDANMTWSGSVGRGGVIYPYARLYDAAEGGNLLWEGPVNAETANAESINRPPLSRRERDRALGTVDGIAEAIFAGVDTIQTRIDTLVVRRAELNAEIRLLREQMATLSRLSTALNARPRHRPTQPEEGTDEGR